MNLAILFSVLKLPQKWTNMWQKILGLSILFLSAMGQEKDPRCPPLNEGLAVHIPHEYDCTKFYKCDWGIPKLFECGYGLHFSVITDRCEYPEDAKCKLSGSSTIRTTVAPPQSTETTLISTETTSIQSTTTLFPVGSMCPTEDDPFNNPIFLPHEEDCSLFYMCFFGDLILYQCSVLGSHWSVELNRCEDPELANCTIGRELTTYSYPTSISKILSK